MRNRSTLLATMLSFTAILSACGGGSDAGDDRAGVSLATKADVARELSVLRIYLAAVTVASAADSSGLVAKRMGPQGVPIAGWTPASSPRAAGFQAKSYSGTKAAERYECAEGGYGTAEYGNQNVRYDYFGVTAASETERYVDNDCVQPDWNGELTYTYNGVFESAYTSNPVQNADYQYDQYGQGSSPQTVRTQSRDGSLDYTVKARFRSEIRNGESSSSIHQLGYFLTLTETASPPVSIELQYGRDDRPLTLDVSSSGQTLNGEYAHISSLCQGGGLSVETLNPIVFGDRYATPVGGVVQIRSGDESVIVRFQSNGDATLQFGSGASATLTQSEVESAAPFDCQAAPVSS